MSIMKSPLARTAAIALATGLLFGCATNNDLAAVRAMAEQAQADAAAARETANEARAMAEQAMTMSRATDERVNRMFQRSMLK